MSKVITPQKTLLRGVNDVGAVAATPIPLDAVSLSSMSGGGVDFDDFSSSSILDFLAKEQECCSDADAESIFREVSRLAGGTDTRSVDEILREAEMLMMKQQLLLSDSESISVAESSMQMLPKHSITLNTKYTKRIDNVRPSGNNTKMLNGHVTLNRTPNSNVPGRGSTIKLPRPTTSEVLKKHMSVVVDDGTVPLTPNAGNSFAAFVENLPSESVISEESTPKDMQTLTCASMAQSNDDADTDDGTDTMEEITEAMETIELTVHEEPCSTASFKNPPVTLAANDKSTKHSAPSSSPTPLPLPSPSPSQHQQQAQKQKQKQQAQQHQQQQLASPLRRAPLNFNATQECSPSAWELRSSGRVRQASVTSDSGLSHTQSTSAHASPHAKSYSDKAVNASPRPMVSALTSPIEPSGALATREHALKHEIELLQEKLKDTEERLQSLRIQHDSLSHLHRELRESNTQLQEESELLKLDVQHLTECANVLRSELQAARNDRNEALELQKTLQAELEDQRQEKKRTLDQKDKDSKVIQDLQRQCREMERILMRKHPDSVSALIVASKNPKGSANESENSSSRKLLEQRIAQLESDAKEQDHKAQQILANVQARFNAVQAKYETHIADLETQVLSLQEINTKLNEKLESQVRTLEYFVNKKAERCQSNSTQTDVESNRAKAYEEAASSLTTTMSTQTNSTALAVRDHSTNTIGGHSASSSTSSTANSTPNNSRPNSKQSGIRKPHATSSLPTMLASKLPVSISDSTISQSALGSASTSVQAQTQALVQAKEDAHLIATIRGMRIDLAIKEKAVQRLTRELDECKRTIKKLQREKDVLRSEKSHMAGATSAATSANSGTRRNCDADHMPASTESQALREAHSKMKLLEADYKSLHEKRLQDLKSLQSAHERELASYHETVRVLQQRLNERDESFSVQKRRKLPVDYYALKAKVSSLERRHTEREERLHLLVEALSKGRLNGALEDLLRENSNQ